jgi:hypothetical protein
MIEVQDRASQSATDDGGLAELADEMATYQERLPDLLRDRPGDFVLIKGREVAGVFPDRSAALRDGYRRFGVVPFLVRQIAAQGPAVFVPNVVL